MILAELNMTNEVVVPIVISVFVGIPLAIYTGIVSSRLVTFAQAKTSAIASLIELPVIIYAANNIYVANHLLINIWVQPHAALLMEGQTEAASKLIGLRNELHQIYQNKLKAALTTDELRQLAISRDDFPVTRWRKICDTAFANYGKESAHYSQGIHQIPLNYWIALTKWDFIEHLEGTRPIKEKIRIL